MRAPLLHRRTCHRPSIARAGDFSRDGDHLSRPDELTQSAGDGLVAIGRGVLVAENCRGVGVAHPGHQLVYREVWVALADDSVIAVLVLDGDSVDQLYVDPGWTGQGVGSGLIHLAKERRSTGLDLWTFQANDGARRFYERHGFVAVDTTDGDNEEGAPDIRYEWRRGPAEPSS